MFRLPFELSLALRYLKPKRGLVSFITLISTLGVTLGVAVLIVVLSVFTGFELKLREKILELNPHIQVFKAGNTMHDYAPIIRMLKSNSEVKAVTPFVFGQVLVETQPKNGETENAAPWVRGVDPTVEPSISILPSSIVHGKFDLTGRGLAIGVELAKDLKVGVGDLLLVYSPADLAKWHHQLNSQEVDIPKPSEYEVRGVFDVGYFQFNHSVIVVSLQNAQDMYNLGESIHGLLVTLKDPLSAMVVRKQLEQNLGPSFEVTTWVEESAQMLEPVIAARNVQFYLLFFITITAAMCILSTLITFVAQKTREVGILKALGCTDLQIAAIFLSQSGFIGTFGIAAGLALGRVALAYRNHFLHFLNRQLHSQLLPSSIYGFDELPAIIVPHDVFLICGSALFVCLLGGVIPAWLASRLMPVDALRSQLG